MNLIEDPYFTSKVIGKIDYPQTVSYLALHQDYSADFVADQELAYDEERCGQIAIDRCLSKHHFGPFEHAQIVINFGYFPHSVMQQVRTHRTGVSFDVQSGRYTSENYVRWANEDKTLAGLEKVIYLRPVGRYRDRSGKDYEYTKQHRHDDLQIAGALIAHAVLRLTEGFSEEHVRGLIPFDIRQHFVFSGNLRACLHLLNVRYKADVQPEAQTWASHLWGHIQDWVPEIAAYYEAKMLGKAKLAP